MKTQDQIQKYIDALVRQGVGAYTAAPPLYRWLWRMRINSTPPFNQTFFQNFIGTALSFVIGMILVFMLLNWVFGSGDMSVLVTVLTKPTFSLGIFGGGLISGLFIASLVKYRSKNLKIPKW